MEIISTGGGKDIPEMSLSAPEQKHFSRNPTRKKKRKRILWGKSTVVEGDPWKKGEGGVSGKEGRVTLGIGGVSGKRGR